jgi:hypothetical protein
VQHTTLHGDPRRAFVDGVDTTAPAPHVAAKDTGVHAVGTGDPRAGWQANATVESAAAWQEEKDFRQAVGRHAQFSRITYLTPPPSQPPPRSAPCSALTPELGRGEHYQTLMKLRDTGKTVSGRFTL